jgi:hypothetical protein
MHDQDMVELEDKKEKKKKKKKKKGKRQMKSLLYARGIYLHHAYFYTLGHGIN